MPSQAVIDDIYNQIKGLQDKIERLQNNPAPTIPIFDPAHPPLDAIEGQIALGTDDKAYKYQNGTWEPIGGTGGGIQFDTYPQAGGNLYIETDFSLTQPWYPDGASNVHARFPSMPSTIYTNGGTLFVGINGAGFSVWTDGAEIDIFSDKTNNGVIRLDTWQWFVNTNYIQIHADVDITIDGYDISMSASPGGISIGADAFVALNGGTPATAGGEASLTVGGDFSSIGLLGGIGGTLHKTGQQFVIGKQINPAGYSQLFRVDVDGTIHTKSGITSFTDDL